MQVGLPELGICGYAVGAGGRWMLVCRSLVLCCRAGLRNYLVGNLLVLILVDGLGIVLRGVRGYGIYSIRKSMSHRGMSVDATVSLEMLLGGIGVVVDVCRGMLLDQC